MSEFGDDSLEEDGGDRTEVFPQEEGHLVLEQVHGFSLAPTIQPVHPYSVVYAAGPLLVVWDWKSEKRRILRKHRCTCTAQEFSADGKILVSADEEVLLWWDSQSWEVVGSQTLRGSSEFGATPSLLRFVYNNWTVVGICQDSLIPAVQTMCVWQLPPGSGEDRQTQSGSEGLTRKLDQGVIHSLSTAPTGEAFLCSDGELSSWHCSLQSLGANRSRIDGRWSVVALQADGRFADALPSPTFNWTFLLASSGTIYVLDDVGNKLRTLKFDEFSFTCGCLADGDSLLAGSTKGSILCFHLPSFHLSREIHYDLFLRDSKVSQPAMAFETKEEAKLRAAQQQSRWDESLCAVMVHRVQAATNVCLRCTADNTVSILDVSNGSVCNAFFGHFGEILSLAVGPLPATKHGACVYSGAADESVGVWELDLGSTGPESRQRFVDVASSLHPSLSCRRALSGPAPPRGSRGSLALAPSHRPGPQANLNPVRVRT